MYGYIDTGPLATSDFATYIIDDQNLIHFGNESGGFNSSNSNVMLFESGPLTPEQHKIVVTNVDKDFFGFQYFVQVQLDAPSSTSSITPSFTSTDISSGTSISSSNSSSTDAIIGGVIGGLIVISLLIIGMIFLLRRNNSRSNALSQMSYAVPQATPDVVNPFTLPPLNPTPTSLPHNYTSNGQSLPSQLISSKFSHRNQPAASTPLTPLRQQLQVASPGFINPSSESPRLPLTAGVWQTNIDRARPRVPEATTEPSLPQRDNARLLRLEDTRSGVRMPPAEDDRGVDDSELPPLYTS